MTYTGIGSRTTPPKQLELITILGEYLGGLGVNLRSGGAIGADSAFQKGCSNVGGRMDIFHTKRYIRYNGNKNTTLYYNEETLKEAERIAEQFHPAWHLCREHARALHTRNTFQILGADLKSPTDFVIAYGPGGLVGGGTSQALRIANASKIPIYNLAQEKDLNEILNNMFLV